MRAELDAIHNHHERAVFETVMSLAHRYGQTENRELLADVACVALNRLPPRYIRHEVDMAFYLTDKERAETDAAIGEAVSSAFQFVQARAAMRARA
jgi:hypothetical protein